TIGFNAFHLCSLQFMLGFSLSRQIGDDLRRFLAGQASSQEQFVVAKSASPLTVRAGEAGQFDGDEFGGGGHQIAPSDWPSGSGKHSSKRFRQKSRLSCHCGPTLSLIIGSR